MAEGTSDRYYPRIGNGLQSWASRGNPDLDVSLLNASSLGINDSLNFQISGSPFNMGHLSSLDLSHNSIGPNGIVKVLEALISNNFPLLNLCQVGPWYGWYLENLWGWRNRRYSGEIFLFKVMWSIIIVHSSHFLALKDYKSSLGFFLERRLMPWEGWPWKCMLDYDLNPRQYCSIIACSISQISNRQWFTVLGRLFKQWYHGIPRDEKGSCRDGEREKYKPQSGTKSYCFSWK